MGKLLRPDMTLPSTLKVTLVLDPQYCTCNIEYCSTITDQLTRRRQLSPTRSKYIIFFLLVCTMLPCVGVNDIIFHGLDPDLRHANWIRMG